VNHELALRREREGIGVSEVSPRQPFDLYRRTRAHFFRFLRQLLPDADGKKKTGPQVAQTVFNCVKELGLGAAKRIFIAMGDGMNAGRKEGCYGELWREMFD
jgi:hypothetical protein